MGFFEKIVYRTSSMLNAVSGVALVAMMVLIFGNVVLRAVWTPLQGTYELTSFLASVTIAFAVAHCATQKGLVAVTLFMDRAPARVRAVFDTLVAIIGTTLYVVLAWQCAKYAMNVYRYGEVSLTTELPFYPFIFGVAFGLLMLALVLFVDIFKSLNRMFSR